MRRFAVVGLLALLVAPGAWSSGVVHTRHDRMVLWRSITESAERWFAEAEAPRGRDLSHLLLVDRRMQTDSVVTIEALDERLSPGNLAKARAQRERNERRFPRVIQMTRQDGASAGPELLRCGNDY